MIENRPGGSVDRVCDEAVLDGRIKGGRNPLTDSAIWVEASQETCGRSVMEQNQEVLSTTHTLLCSITPDWMRAALTWLEKKGAPRRFLCYRKDKKKM